MSGAKQVGQQKKRIRSKEVRREQLIHATMKCIAESGLSGTTMARVTQTAGLSLGIANLHFESKEKLLTETLRKLADEYANGHHEILNNTKYETVSDKLQALLDFNFSPKITQKTKLAVWFAFCGEAKSRPTYQRICSRSDVQAGTAIHDLFKRAITEGNYKNAELDVIASGYTALIDGLWLELLVAPGKTSKAKAKRIALHYLASAFPKHIQFK